MLVNGKEVDTKMKVTEDLKKGNCAVGFLDISDETLH